MQLEVVWSPLLQAGSEGPALISCAVMHTPYNIQKRARGALAEIAILSPRELTTKDGREEGGALQTPRLLFKRPTETN